MTRRFGWAMLVAAGIVLGFVSSSYQRSSAEPPAPVDAETRETDALAQLKEINAQLKEINTMLRTGTAKVTVAAGIINPGSP